MPFDTGIYVASSQEYKCGVTASQVLTEVISSLVPMKMNDWRVANIARQPAMQMSSLGLIPSLTRHAMAF